MRTGRPRRDGPLGPVGGSYRSYLQRLEYSPGTVKFAMAALGHVGRWMATRGLEPGDLCRARVEEYLAYREAAGPPKYPARWRVERLLDFLVAEGLIIPPGPPALTPLEALISGYAGWLAEERGFSPASVRRYAYGARRFLHQRATGPGGDLLTGVTAGEVNRFILSESRVCGVTVARGRVTEMRSLARYLYLQGLTPTSLAEAIPPMACWHDTRIPPTLSRADSQALLDSCDRSTPSGARDYAMMMLAARLGLRSIEVARLLLDDVDWRRGEILIRGKGGHQARLPLPVDVGEALAAYVVDARPASGSRELFLTIHAPGHHGICPHQVGNTVKSACHRSGLPPVGAHRLRHALACEMVAAGVSLRDISQVLRHRDLATTALYAKVDLASLRQVARPWPRVAS